MHIHAIVSFQNQALVWGEPDGEYWLLDKDGTHREPRGLDCRVAFAAHKRYATVELEDEHPFLQVRKLMDWMIAVERLALLRSLPAEVRGLSLHWSVRKPVTPEDIGVRFRPSHLEQDKARNPDLYF